MAILPIASTATSDPAVGPSSRMEAWLMSSGTDGSLHAGSCSSVTAAGAAWAEGGLIRETGRTSATANAVARRDLLKYR